MLSALLSSMTTVFAYLIVLLAGAWCWFQWSHWELLRVARSLPSTLQTLPVLGHAQYTVFGLDRATQYALDMSMDAVARGINTICFWCGPLPVIMVHGLEDIQKILNSSVTSEKGYEMEFFKYAVGNGLLTASNDWWKVTRRHINPIFNFRNLDQLTPEFNRNSRGLVAVLSEHVGRGPVNVMDHTMDVALKTVCHLVFGPDVEIDIKSEGFRGLMKVVEKIPDLFIRRILRVWLRIDSIFEFLYRKELDEIEKLWKNFSETPLKFTKENNELKKSKNSLPNGEGVDIESDIPAEGPLNLVDVYSVLQKNFPQFSDQDLKGEMLTFFGTGTDTVGAAVASCILILAQYIDIQERLYNEISSVVGPDDDVSQEDLNRMPYLDQVYRETLRWTAIVPYILRKPSENLKLSNCTIPAGNTVIVCLRGIHMDPKLYPDPHKFDPERFSSENKAGRERYAFIPFSGGPRNCVGKTYAQMLIKTVLVHVLRRYKVSTSMNIHTMKRRLVVTLVSADGYNVTLENRL